MDGLNVIHVAGTKGKGSTCAFTRSFLQVHGERTGYPKKIGLYTSPHIKVIRERIQIDSNPIDEDLFAKYLFEIWNKLPSTDFPRPRFLQLMLLLAIHTFIRENVDVVILETHAGGEYDATNIFDKPIATGITTIGMDHVEQLGPTIQDIAWHKAGIFKKGTPSFSMSQDSDIATILEKRAHEKQSHLEFIQSDDLVGNNDLPAMRTAVQRKNASLALKLADCFLQQKGFAADDVLTPNDVRKGIENFFWIGRFQQITHGTHRWFLDGAHNELSVPFAAQWFVEIIRNDFRSLATKIPHLLCLLILTTVIQSKCLVFSFSATFLDVMEQLYYVPLLGHFKSKASP